MDSTLLIDKLDLLCDQITQTINQSKVLVAKSVKDFVNNDVKILGGLIGAYHRFFKEIEVKSRKDAEKIWTKLLIKDKNVEEKVDLLFTLEDSFDEFLHEIDKKLNKEEMLENSKIKLKTGDVLCDRLTVTTVDGKDVLLKKYLANVSSLIIIFLRHFA